jgi:prevent-host-death family protein
MVTRCRSISARQLGARCLAVLDEVRESRRPVLVTKRGKPVARLVPVEDVNPRESLRGSVIYERDLVSPIGDAWGARKWV